MAKTRLVITAVVLEGRSKSEVSRDYGVSRYWVHQLVKRYQAEGEAAFDPRSRRPHSSPRAVGGEMEDRILRLRKELSKQGLDAGADTIHTHLTRAARRTPRSKTSTSATPVPSVSTIWRILTRRGFVTPQPQKRPKSSRHRFTADQPNQRWRADITHWQIADGTEAEILHIEDDHSRLDLLSAVTRSFTAPAVLTDFRTAFKRYGIPTRVLTDNGAVFTGKPRRSGQVALESELIALRVKFDHSRPYHPQTCGKVERFHQTQKKWLAAQPPATDHQQLQHQLNRFRRYYNTTRRHRALDRKTPAEVYTARPNPARRHTPRRQPPPTPSDTHGRVRAAPPPPPPPLPGGSPHRHRPP